MKYFFALFSLILIFNCADKKENSNTNGLTIKDDLNKKFTFSESPRRIISLAPNITELLFELGLGDRIVANTTYCNFPEAAKEIDKVGDLLSVNFEKVLSFKPDIIFITTEGNTKIVYDKLISLKQKVFVLNPKSFDDIKKDYEKIAKIFGRTTEAKIKIEQWNSVEDSVRNIFQTQSSKRAMFLVSTHPVILAGKKTFVNEFLKIVKLKNIAEGIEINYPVFSREEILIRNPEIIFHTTHAEKSIDIFNSYPEWQKLDAIKKRQVYYLNPDIFFRPGPRYIEGIRVLSRILRH